jgi:hypothetical protein
VTGAGAARVVGSSDGVEVRLWGAQGPLGGFPFGPRAGDEDDARPTALALARGAERVALAGAGARARVVDREGRARGRGGEALAVRFVGERWVAVHADGEVVAYAADGRARRVAAAGPAALVAFAPDGRRVALAGAEAVRELDVETGRVLGTVAAPRAAMTRLRLADDGTVAWVDALGGVETWRPGEAAARGVAAAAAWVTGARVTPDGRYLRAEFDRRAATWALATGARVDVDPGLADAVARGRDGGRAAWLAAVDGELRVRVPDHELAGVAPRSVAVAPDGDEVFVLCAGARLLRWRPATGERAALEDDALLAAERVEVSADGAVLLLQGRDRVMLRTADAHLRPLATVYLHADGGWTAVSRSGAVDGTDPEATLTRASGPDRAEVYSGRLLWDARHVPGVLTRALAGEDTEPPLP